ncbi:MAG: hypothetical protein J0M04_03125 [Verrucomicrobia bacterium]|nr:hypothetical protein [Verrucomicrobiota bacterium]
MQTTAITTVRPGLSQTRGFLTPVLFIALASLAPAAITVPGADGSDGTLNITANTEIDLSQAVTGTWDQNNAANAGKGVYDPAKWAVVFKYSSVTVATGATVTFKNHASRAPVVWLVNGNVTINGTVSLNGQGSVSAPALSEAGPGGFRGGTGNNVGLTIGSGFGLGGSGSSNRIVSPGGSYGSNGEVYSNGEVLGVTYGNASNIPLIGGSGAGGTANSAPWSGGAGGGAILIASSASVSIDGYLRANGGTGGLDAAGGSGGAIRIVAETLSGNGNLAALGGGSHVGIRDGGVGRIRLERTANLNSISVMPAPSTVDLAAGATALLWPPTGSPEVKVMSIGAVSAPADPRAAFGTYGPDVALPLTSSTQVVVETVNVEQASQVKVRITPRDSANFTVVDAVYSSTVSTEPLTIRWTATVPTNMGYSAVQAHVIRP